MKDDAGVVQIFSIPIEGAEIQQVTHLDHSVQAQFNISPDGKQLAVIADNSIWLIDSSTGKSTRLTERSNDDEAPIGGALWSHDGKMLVYNRYKGKGDDRYLQIFKVDLE